MAIALRSTTTTVNTTTTTSHTLSKPSGVTAGDVLIVSIACNGNTITAVPTDWVKIYDPNTDGGTVSNPKLYGYYLVVTSSHSAITSWSWTTSGAIASSMGCAAYTGVDTTTPLDTAVSAADQASGTTLSLASVTTTVANAWLVSAGALNSSNVNRQTNEPTGFNTERWDLGGKRHAYADMTVASAGATGAQVWGFPDGYASSGWMVALRPASTGSAGDVTAVVATATSQEGTPVVTGQAVVVHDLAEGSASSSAPTVSAAATVTGVRAQGSSLAVAPAVEGAQVATVAAVPAQGSSLAVQPVVTGGSGVTAVAAQASSTAIAPAISGAQDITAVRSQASSLAVAPLIVVPHSAAAVLAQGSSLALAPAVTAESIVISVRAQGTSTAIAPAVSNGAVNTYHLFLTTPQVGADSDTGSVNLGTEFYVTAPAWVTEVRYLQPATGGTSTSRVATIWSTTDGNTGTMVAGPFTIPAPAAGTWGVFELPTPFELTPNTRYRISVRHPDGRYAATGGYFNAGGDGQTTLTQGILVRPSSTDALGNDQGSYEYSASNLFPINSFNAASYYSDITVVDAEPSGEANVSAVRAQASSAAIAPAVTAPHTVTAVRALASSTAIAPAVAGAQTVAAVRAQASSLALAPVASGAQVLVAVRAQATSLAPAPAVSAAASATVSSPAMLATADAIEPYVSGGGPANVTGVVATASGDMLEPVVSVIATVTAVKAGATSGAVAPVARGAVSVQSVRSVATATAVVPAVEVLALIAAVNMTAAALHRAPALSLEAITLAVFSTATAMMIAPKVGNTSELYLKDGTRVLPYMLSGGILIPVDPQF